MNNVRNTVTCARCAKNFSFEHIRFLPDGKRVACLECLGIIQKDTTQKHERDGKVYDYQCLDCHHMFKRGVKNQPRICPACGKNKLMKFEKEKLDSKKLLQIADDPRLDEVK